MRASSFLALLAAAYVRRAPRLRAQEPAAAPEPDADGNPLFVNATQRGLQSPATGVVTGLYPSAAAGAAATPLRAVRTTALAQWPQDDPVLVPWLRVPGELGRGGCGLRLAADGRGLAHDPAVLRVAELAVCQALHITKPLEVEVYAPQPYGEPAALQRQDMAVAVALAAYSYLTQRQCNFTRVAVSGGLSIAADGRTIALTGVPQLLDRKLHDAYGARFARVVIPGGPEGDAAYRATSFYARQSWPERRPDVVLCDTLACVAENALLGPATASAV